MNVPTPAGLTTDIVPFVAPFGTVTRICVGETTVNCAAVALPKRTAVTPVKRVPVSKISTPAIALAGCAPVTVKGWKVIVADVEPPMVEIANGPVVVCGMVKVRLLFDSRLRFCGTSPFTRTVKAFEIKFAPVTVTRSPGKGLAGSKLVTVGGETT